MRAVALDPDDREALYWHGWLQLLAGNLGLADRDLNRLLQVSVAANDDRVTYRAYLRAGRRGYGVPLERIEVGRGGSCLQHSLPESVVCVRRCRAENTEGS
jgi:hypothetical protein